MRLKQKILGLMTSWLEHRPHSPDQSLANFDRVRQLVCPGAVILVEGRSRVAGVVQTVTLSSWSHMMLCIGQLGDLRDRELAARLPDAQDYADDEQLVVTAVMGQGVTVQRLADYAPEHLRLCRPYGLTDADVDAIIDYCLARLGRGYDERQILDMLRFFMPYTLLPRRWRSSLFNARPGTATHEICSTFLVKAFNSVNYPVLPQTSPGNDGQPVSHRRNIRLMPPRDFDYSPYFNIVKYPLFDEGDGDYRDSQRPPKTSRLAQRRRSEDHGGRPGR